MSWRWTHIAHVLINIVPLNISDWLENCFIMYTSQLIIIIIFCVCCELLQKASHYARTTNLETLTESLWIEIVSIATRYQTSVGNSTRLRAWQKPPTNFYRHHQKRDMFSEAMLRNAAPAALALCSFRVRYERKFSINKSIIIFKALNYQLRDWMSSNDENKHH